MCLGKENIALLRSFDDLSDSGSINIWSLRDRQESRQQHTITLLTVAAEGCPPPQFVLKHHKFNPIFCGRP